jgi:serine/threonine-protein kinase
MGIVYRAHDPELGRAVALKFLPPHLSGHPEVEKRFAREAKAAAALDYPHIATIYEIGQAEPGTAQGQRYIAMAYYEGETLKEKLEREGPLPIEEALGYAEQIAGALAAAHEAQIVHRNVKPANVMVTGEGQVKLLDFGLAHLAERSRITESGRRLGTAAYMSPEQAEGREVGPEADLWALGTVLYEMLAGRRPFCAGRDTAVLHAVLYEEPSSLEEHRPDAPPALAQIVRRCLAKVPGRRYGSAGELIEDLESIGSPEGSLSMATSSWGWAEAESPSTSIAVLPFESFGGREAGPFTRGLHGDLITRLANVSGLKVIARTSVQQYRGVERTVEEISREVGARWILEGEVQEAGGELRVRGRLISTRDGRQAWTGTYQRALVAERLFELQAELTKDIVGSLEAELTPGETQRIERQTTQDLGPMASTCGDAGNSRSGWKGTWRRRSTSSDGRSGRIRGLPSPGRAWPTRREMSGGDTPASTRSALARRRQPSGPWSWIRTWRRPTPRWG